MNGRPCWSSCQPGPSPISMTCAFELPSPGTALVRVRASSQRGQTTISLAISRSLISAVSADNYYSVRKNTTLLSRV